MILDNGNIDVRKLLGGDVDGLPVTQIGVGTSSTAVTSADTSLTSPVLKPVTNVQYLSGGIVKFNATLDAGDPAMTIREVGLFDANDVLLFRKVIPDRIKSAGISASVFYSIKVQ